MEKVKLYEITADYRPNNPNKPKYYVRAKNKSEAKKRFDNKIGWLKIYSVHECSEDMARKVVGNPQHYIIV